MVATQQCRGSAIDLQQTSGLHTIAGWLLRNCHKIQAVCYGIRPFALGLIAQVAMPYRR